MSIIPFDDLSALYIHWPFCPYKCSFCPFVAFSKMDRFMGEYHTALIREVASFAQSMRAQVDPQIELKTIYIGGGTPSTWPIELLLDMYGILNGLFDMRQLEEMTIEVNPGTVTPELLQAWKKVGITRISVGVQSLNDQVLAQLTRHQKADDVRKLMKWADGLFNSISIDLIIGLPGVSADEWKRQIQEIVTWPIRHISVYFLSIHEGTELYFKVRRNSVVLPPDDEIVDLYYWTIDMFAQHGFLQYEISSFAKPGYESKHNRAYWTRKQYKGFGVGAWSFDGESRFQNEKKLMTYIEAQTKGESCVVYREKLTEENIRFEKIMLGLRTLEGVSVEDATVGLSDAKINEFFEKVAILAGQNLINQAGGRIYLTTRSFSIENEIATALFIEK